MEVSAELFSLKSERQEAYGDKQNKYKSRGYKTSASERFLFNPNQLSEADWRRLGLKDWQIKIIKKFESKGGAFRVKSDFAKMYPINEELYLSLKPYIDLPEELPRQQPNTPQRHEAHAPPIIDINLADSAALVSLRGIGPGISRLIMNYRAKLGGFNSIDQLKEVYKLTSEVIDQNRARLSVDTALIHKLNINELDAAMLKNHPYISWNIANSIVRIREMHGKYNAVEDVQKSDLINEETYRKLAPYLSTH